MKRANVTSQQVIDDLLNPDQGSVDRVSDPLTPEQAIAEREALTKIAQDPTKVRTVCIGCDADVAILDAAPCVCGGFVCAACQRIEDEGVCGHIIADEPPEPEMEG